jgi:hypothetical protein
MSKQQSGGKYAHHDERQHDFGQQPHHDTHLCGQAHLDCARLIFARQVFAHRGAYKRHEQQAHQPHEKPYDRV